MTDDGFPSSPDGQQPRHALHDARRRAEHAAPRDTPVGRHERRVGKHAATASDLGVKPLGADGGEPRHVHRHEVQELAVQSEQDPVTDFMSMSGGQPIALWDGREIISTSAPRPVHSTFAQDVSSSVEFAHHAADGRQGSDDGADGPFVIGEDAEEPPLDLADIRTYLRHRAAEGPEAGADDDEASDDDAPTDDDGAHNDDGGQGAEASDGGVPAVGVTASVSTAAEAGSAASGTDSTRPAASLASTTRSPASRSTSFETRADASQPDPQFAVSQSDLPPSSVPRSSAGRHARPRRHVADQIDDMAIDDMAWGDAAVTPHHGAQGRGAQSHSAQSHSAQGLDAATRHAGTPVAPFVVPASARPASSGYVADGADVGLIPSHRAALSHSAAPSGDRAASGHDVPSNPDAVPSRPIPDVHAPDPVTTGHVAAKVPGTDIVLYTSNPAAVAVALELAGGLERSDAPASYPVKPDARPQHPRSAFSHAYPFLIRHHALESDAERRHRTRRREVYDESLHLIDDLTNRPVDPLFEDAALYRRKESPRTTWGMRILSFVICILIGFVFMGAVQLLQSNTREKVRKEEADQLTQLVTRSEDLQNEVSALRKQVDELSKSSSTTVKIPDSQNILNGTVEVTGPGIVITLRNPSLLEESSGGASGTDSTLSGMRDVADTDIQLFVDRLWATGAEAISVNGQRLGPETSIRAAGGKILIGVVAIQSPYTIEAIGNADAMRVGVDSDHNPQLYDSFDKLGIAVSLSQKDKLNLSANAVATLEYATEGTGNGDGSD
ncbi:DUF881 domain-containing protein [Pseudoscardovia radai]|uniref:DUF881 domain-containing protein n=1 Tax=Pseudoscardovia radai TaxID=987066 RepID=UPI0039927D22